MLMTLRAFKLSLPLIITGLIAVIVLTILHLSIGEPDLIWIVIAAIAPLVIWFMLSIILNIVLLYINAV